MGAVTSDAGAISITTNDGNADPLMHLANIDVNGLVTSGAGAGNISLDADGDITLNLDGAVGGADTDVINAGTGAVTLTADGNVTQDIDGTITATSLNVVQQDAAGNVTLDDANTVGTFTASNADTGGTITFNNDISLVVGAVTSDDGNITITTDDGAGGTNTAGITVTGLVSSIGAMADGSDGEILISADGSMSLNGPGGMAGDATDIVVNSGTAITRLVGNGTISQTDDGLITAATLGVRQDSATAGFNINLCEANVVGTFAANNASDGFISFQSTQSFTTGSVPAVTGFVVTNGVTTQGGLIELQSGGTLTIAVAPNGIDSNGGSVSLIGATDVVLNEALNTVGGDILISDGGALALNQTLTTTGTVRLLANGSITQTSIITAGSLGARIQATAADNSEINLSLLNEVGIFAAENLADGGQVEFLSNQDLILGNVVAGTGKAAVFTAVNGVSSTAFGGQTANLTDANDRGDILIETRGSLTLAVDGLIDGATGVAGQTTAISAAGGLSDARLIADGAIIQDSDGLIVADELGVRLQDDVDVAIGIADEDISLGFGNSVNEVAVLNESVGGAVTFQSFSNLTVGVVAEQAAANANIDFTATTGILTTNTALNTTNDILIEAGGFLNLDEAVNTDATVTGSDADVRLIADGDIAQDAEGVITANELGVLQRQATHDNANDIGMDDSQHDIDLGFENNIDQVAVRNVEAAAEINIRSTRNLLVGNVVAQVVQGANFELTPAMGNAVVGISSTNGDILAHTDGALTIDANETFDGIGTGTAINSGGATTRLVANGDIRQDSDGLITANALGVRQLEATAPIAADPADIDADLAHDIDLGYVNSVNIFAATNANDANGSMNADGGIITFQSGNALTIDTVTAASNGNASFVATSGVSTTNGGAAVASRDTDGDGVFETLDVLAGDILIDTAGSLTVNAAVNAAGGNSDVRLAANGAVTQTAIVTANELNVRQDAATADTAITLTMDNIVDEFAAFNASDNGDISFTDANDLNINVLVAQAIPHATVSGAYTTFATNGMRFDMNVAAIPHAVANVAVGASGGDITIESGGDLTIIGVDNAANQRFIYSSDIMTPTIDTSMATDGESISLSATGDITLQSNVIITTDENSADLASSATTSDSVTIVADSDAMGVDGTVTIADGVEIRTDGGVAITFASRPSEGGTAFYQGIGNPIAASLSPTSLDGGLTTQAAFMVDIGNAGEENLRVDIDWQDVNDGDITVNPADFPDLAGTDNVIDSESDLIDFLANDDRTYTFGHVYSVLDVNDIVANNGGTATVRFGVSHHESISVAGNRVDQNGANEAVPDGIISQTAGDNDPLTTDTGFEDGRAEFNFVNTPLPPVLENDPAPQPNPAPPNPEPVQIAVPLTVVNVEAPVASRVGVSSQSFDYFQLRRNEGEAGYEIIDEQISEDNGESLLDPKTLKQYVDDNNIPDEQDYELWLITTKVNNAGQSVTLERPILKFDVSGGRPIPAIEDLPMEFPELRLEPIPLDGDAEVEPVENSDMNEADPEADKQEVPEKVEEEQDTVSLLDETDQIQRLDGSHQASAIGVGSVLAVSNLNRKKSSIEGRRVRNASLLSRIFGGNSSN